MTNNPDIIDWLESDDGREWTKHNYRQLRDLRIRESHNGWMAQVKEDAEEFTLPMCWDYRDPGESIEWVTWDYSLSEYTSTYVAATNGDL